RVFPLVYGDRATRVWMVAWAFLLLVVSLALVPFHLGGLLYSSVASVLGVAFLLLVLRGAYRDGGRAWARQVFRFSVVHLTALFVALLLSTDVHARRSLPPRDEVAVAHRLH